MVIKMLGSGQEDSRQIFWATLSHVTGDWAYRRTTWALWGLILFLMLFLLWAVAVDVWRVRSNKWSDEHMLVTISDDEAVVSALPG